MHVMTRTELEPDEVRARIARFADPAPSGSEPKLRLDRGREPWKLFLVSFPAPVPAAAEVAISGPSRGAEVVLRLMWGPLPAPFPRALAGAGLLVAAAVLAWAPPGGGVLASALLAGVPVALLALQARGEKRLQSRLGSALGGVRFAPRPH